MRVVTGGSLLAGLAAAAVTGCGSSKQSSTATGPPGAISVASGSIGPLPQPKEPLSAFEKRLTKATDDAAAGRCAQVRAFEAEVGYSFRCTAGRPSRQMSGFRITGSATYGTAAVIEYTEGDVGGRGSPIPGFTPPVKRATAVLSLALAPTGRYFSIQIGGAPILEGPVIGTKPNGWSGADRTAVIFLASVKTNACKTWDYYTLTPNGMSEQRACALGLRRFYAALHRALSSESNVKLYRLGGNDFVYFYAFRAGGKLRTLAVARSGKAQPPFFAIGEVRSE